MPGEKKRKREKGDKERIHSVYLILFFFLFLLREGKAGRKPFLVNQLRVTRWQ